LAYTTIDFFPIPFLVGIIILALLLVWQWRQKHNLVVVLCLFLFGFYLLILLDVVYFPIRIPADWPHNITLQNIYTELYRINLIPLRYTNTFRFSRRIIFIEIIGNILLTMPVGFLLPFLVRIPPRRIYWIALATGLILEGSQLLFELLGIVAGYPHRIDISDVITNGTGVLLGYGLYRVVVWLWSQIKVALIGMPSTNSE
jgi:glycopeptide antibiotics resistance protein